MKIEPHIAATLTISGIIYLVFNSFPAFVSSFIGGILIDLDHFVDYYRHEGVNLRIGYFIRWCYEDKWESLILFLHSVELMFLLWIVIFIFKLGIFWTAFAAGVSQHMILDILFNSDKMKVYSYFFVYRLYAGFRKECIIRQDCY